jgi:hypothetical protein
MLKRYQVFISSTYIDLKEERKKIIESVLRIDCFPVGMELFPATTETQMEFIKKMIDESDFYVIILAGKYGTIPQGDEKSYTEMEYEYACSTKKPVIALLHSNPEKLSVEYSETVPKIKRKLEYFRNNLKNSRIVQFWDTQEQLATYIPQNIFLAIRNYEYRLRGWTRLEIDIFRLTGLLNNYQGSMLTTLPVYVQSEKMKMVQFNEIKGLMNLSNLLGKVNVHLELLSGKELISTQDSNEVCIGGPLSNEASNIYMKMYVPQFRCIIKSNADFFTREDVNFFIDMATESEDGKEYFILGDTRLSFAQDGNGEWGFILKIDKGYNNYCYIFFGETSVGTLAIIDFFCQNYSRIYDRFLNNPFFMAIKMNVKGRMIADMKSLMDFSNLICPDL